MLAIGSRGILISREIDPVTNQFVWTTALDAHGLSTQIVNAIEINGGQIKGNIISSYDDTTWINLDNGTFNFKDKIKYIDGKFSIVMKSDGTTTDEFLEEYEKDKEDIQKDIDEVYETMNILKDTIDDAINDGIITESELATISNAIIQLNKEKDDMVARYNNIKDNDYLSDEILIKLNEAFNNYIDIHNVLVSFINTVVADRVITEIEKGFYEDHSSDYSDKLSKLSVEIDNALSDILENSTTYQVENLKTSLDKDFEDVYNKIDEILDDVGGAIADGIIDEAELLIIKNTIIQLDKEKEDVDMSYSSIHDNSDLDETSKTNLERSHASYTASHANLKNVINNMVVDGKVTDQERIAFDTATKNYSTALANFKNYATLSLEMITKNYTDAKIEVLEDSISLKVSGAEMTEYVSDVKTSLQNQLDGKIESYYQTTNPGTNWTDAERTKHKGDIWHDSLNNVTYRWSGTNWIKLTDSDAETAKALANTKAKIFTTTPTPPYNKGDLWAQGTSGDIMRCNTTRTSGSYIASDWAKASKYTDDTQANNVLNNLTTNYYTITETEAQIKVAKESITSTVSSTYTTKDDMNNTLTNYAKKSDLSQTADSITATFTSSGGGNLVKNGDFKNETKFWTERVYNLTGADTTHWYKVQKNERTGNESALEMVIRDMSSGECAIYQTIETVIGRQYVLTCYLAGHRGNYSARVRGTVDDKWGLLASRDYGKIVGGLNPNDWHQVVIPFVAERTDTMVDFQITSSVGVTGNNTYMWIKRIMVCEGKVWTPFVPHSSEVYTGITKIDQDGITVSHSQVSTKSQMTANGFFINDRNGDVIAELSSTNQWSILRADEVYAKNIERVYMGDANLYVDHSKSTCGTGTSSSPFNSFSALTSHFEDKGTILNKDVTVNVVSTGNVSDNLDIRGLSGRGTLTIKLNKGLILNSNGVTESAIYFYDCNTIITVNGGRSAYNSADGALLNKWGCGVRFTKCKYARVEYLAVDSTKNNKMGVMFDATDGIVDKVDTCNSYHGLWATRGSQVYQYDCCGSASTSYYSGEGALILIGGEANGIKINGSYRRVSGNILDFGTNPTGRASYRTPPAVPATQTYTQSFTSSGYGYYSVGQACWNPNGQKVYQGDWGYGNNKGIYLLPNSSINSFYSGSTIISGATIKLSRANSGGYSSAQNVYLCGTTATAVGSGSNPPVTKSYGNIGTLAWGETKTFTLPSAFCTDLKAGTIKSIMFYTSDGSNYILFGNSCTLTLKCNK